MAPLNALGKCVADPAGSEREEASGNKGDIRRAHISPSATNMVSTIEDILSD